MVRRFDDHTMTVPERALQIWLILISHARNRQTVTYRQLADELRYKEHAERGLGQRLDPILRYCAQNDLPPLTVVVVNQDSGEPGKGYVGTNLNFDRERVFNFPWFTLIPPTPDEFQAVLD